MSRIGKKGIDVPKDVVVAKEDGAVAVTGKFGKLTCPIPDAINVEFDPTARQVSVSRVEENATARSLHGLTRSLISNMVSGVSRPWEKRLEIVGVGYQASVSKGVLTLNVGFANPLLVTIPATVKCELPDATHIVLTSADKQLVGQIAADIRSLRPPEPYKGKGIRYSDEHVRRKSGKAFGS